MTHDEFMQCFMFAIRQLTNFKPTDDVLAGTLGLKKVTARDKKFFTLGQDLTIYGVMQTWDLLVKKAAGEVEQTSTDPVEEIPASDLKH